jgi:hypothetical protein
MGELTADVGYADKRNRLTCVFRGILAIPHVIVAYFWGIVAEIVAIPQWFIIVFTGKRNEALWDLQWSWLAYAGRVSAYQYLLFDEYPAFGTDQSKVPMVQDLSYGEPASRLTNGLRFLWIIPALIIATVLGIAVSVVLLIAWFAILFTGKFPRGMFEFTMKVLRYSLQLTSYALMMTDSYPKWGSGVPAVGAAPVPPSAPQDPTPGIVPPAPAT